MARTCTKEFTIEIVEAGCPTPTPVTFTVPYTGNKEFPVGRTDLHTMACIGSAQKIAVPAIDTSAGCLDILNFAGVPVFESTFSIPAETGWQMMAAHYDPASDVIVAITAKTGQFDRAVFFDPSTGYISHEVLATISASGMAVYMPWSTTPVRGSSGLIAFMRPSYTAGITGELYVFNCHTKSIDRYFSPGPAGTVHDSGFGYSCDYDEFYLHTTTGIRCINATTGATNNTWPQGYVTGNLITYCDSTKKVVIARSDFTDVGIINPVDGNVDLAYDINDDLAWPWIEQLWTLRYNFKLDCLMLTIDYDEIAVPPWDSQSGVIFLNPTTLAPIDTAQLHGGYTGSPDEPISFNESSGDVYAQLGIALGDRPFFQIRPTIT